MSGLTKIFIVLQLVFSVALSVLLAQMVSKQENYRNQVNDANTGRIALVATVNRNQAQIADLTAAVATANKALQDQMAKDQKDAMAATTAADNAKATILDGERQRAALQTQLTSLTNTTETLKTLLQQKDADLEKLRPQVSILTIQNAELNRANNDATNSNRAAEEAIRRLQEQIAAAEASPKTGAANPAEVGGSPVLSATNQTAVAINGRVTDLANSPAGKPLIQTNLGERDGVRLGTRFAIFRDSKYVGDAIVQRVTPDQSVAGVVLTKPGEAVQNGDIVQSGN